MPPPGKRAAAWSWKSDTFTKALEELPSASFSLLHQIFSSPSGKWTFAELQVFRWSLIRIRARRMAPGSYASNSKPRTGLPFHASKGENPTFIALPASVGGLLRVRRRVPFGAWSDPIASAAPLGSDGRVTGLGGPGCR